MRSFPLPALAAAILSMSGVTPALADDYKIDPSHTHVLFMVDHLGFSKMIGLFTDVSGAISFDAAKVDASKLNVTIKTASLQSQFAPRDQDLKGADWFNVTEFPEMTFVGTKFVKKDEHSGEIQGTLTLLSVARPVTLQVTFNKQGVRPSDKAQAVGFSAHGSLNRTEFGLKTFAPYIGETVDLLIETEATK